jgi:sensor histidine kinase regulating citrate/malate metabolism
MKFLFNISCLFRWSPFSRSCLRAGRYYYFDASHQLYQEMSARAKIQAEEIALMPNLRQQVSQQDRRRSGVYAKNRRPQRRQLYRHWR